MSDTTKTPAKKTLRSVGSNAFANLTHEKAIQKAAQAADKISAPGVRPATSENARAEAYAWIAIADAISRKPY